MECARIREQLNAYEDGELDAVRARELEAHLVGCPGCLRAEERLTELRRAVREHAVYHAAPAALREAVAGMLHVPERSVPRRITLRWWQLGGLLAATGAASALCLLVALNAASPKADERLASELVADHVRALMQNHLLDVASTDQHTVKPWFAGKLDYSPPVRDLADAGFPLVGGRLDYVRGRVVAALIYQRRQHRINVFVWPASGHAVPVDRAMTVNRYNVLGWSAGAMHFWAVSDLNAPELEELKSRLLQPPAPDPPLVQRPN